MVTAGPGGSGEDLELFAAGRQQSDNHHFRNAFSPPVISNHFRGETTFCFFLCRFYFTSFIYSLNFTGSFDINYLQPSGELMDLLPRRPAWKPVLSKRVRRFSPRTKHSAKALQPFVLGVTVTKRLK